MPAHLLVGDIAARGRELGPDRVAVAHGDTGCSYGELDDRVDALATHLLDLGVGAGQRVTLMSPNCVEALATVLAASLIGATVVPMNLRLRPDDMRFQIDDAGVVAAVVHPDVTVPAQAAGVLDRPHWTIGDAVARPDAARLAAHRPDHDAVLIQLYTSGTTGTPKGCQLTQRAWLASTAASAHLLQLGPTDALATPLPFFHVAGLDLALSTLSAAGTVVIPDGPDVPSTWAAVERHGATIVQTLGSYRKLLRKAPRDLHRLRGIYGNSRWDSELDQLPAEFSIWTGYGSTELCGFAVGHNRATLAASPGTIGRPMLGYAATVVDERDRPVARGAVGELLMRGPALTTGYWGLPDASADALRGGWLHTGDLVEVREDGTLRFADRLKDMVKPGGENVYCIEVEEALAACPGVLEVAVIGVPDPRWGEAVKAVVAVRPDVTVEQLDAWALERLAPYKRPRWYEFVDALPRNALSKVVKTDLRAAHDEHSSIRLPERS